MKVKHTTIALALTASVIAAPIAAQQPIVPPLDHVFVLMLENHSYGEIVGNSNAPVINALASKFNSATNYYAVWYPSLPNYLAVIAGDYFGVSDDKASASSVPPGPWTFDAPTVGSQLEAAGKDWKDYQEDIPAIGSHVAAWPGDADTGSLYAVKHNPFAYFRVHQTPAGVGKMVPLTELFSDLASKTSPAFSFIVPNQCNDMHSQDNPLSPCYGYDDAAIIARGDHETGLLEEAITGSRLWKKGRNALFIVFDEAGEIAKGSPVVALVITNYSVSGVQDPTYYTHYSLLKTIEAAFGLPYLGHAADPATQTMAPMLQPRPADD